MNIYEDSSQEFLAHASDVLVDPVCERAVVDEHLGPGHHAAGFSIMIGRGRSGRDRKNLRRGHTTFSVSRRSALAAAAACT